LRNRGAAGYVYNFVNKTLRHLSLLAALPVAVLIGGQAAAASAPPTDPPADPAASELPPPIPADFVELIDDTNTITVSVPGEWTDVDLAPRESTPSIEASTDRETYNATFDVAGVTFLAAPFEADTESAAQQFGLTSGCADETVEPYNDGVFAGSQLIYTGCGDGAAEFHVIAANPANQAFTALLRIQITGADEQPILQGILDTFNMTAEAVGGASTVPATTAAGTTGDAFPPLTGEIPSDWTRIVDDTQTIAISVPATWTAIDPAPGQNDDGTPRPWISATTDQDLFIPPQGTADTFSVPGVIFQAAPTETDTAQRLAASSFNEQCTPGPVQTYDDGVYVGHIQRFDACGGTGTSIVLLAANPSDGAYTAMLLIQLTGQPDDEATLNGLLLSFSPASLGGAATPTTAPAAPTTVAAPTTTVTG
jgi:hypothetical protein